jgi:ferrous iron transport protein B
MRRFGLPGKAVIPLLSSHACNIPGIMSTRILDNPKERLITMMVIPLTTCSARIPVYVMLIGALAPADKVFGIFNTAGVILFGLYVFSMFMTFVMAFVFKKIMKVKRTSMLLMELPSYHIPQLKNLWKTIVFQSKTFLTKVGSVVVVLSICIWILVSFPMKDDGSVSEIENSYAANIGKSALVIFRPLGFDWKITTALIPSFAAREVLVSSLATVLAVDANENHSEPLSESMKTLYSVPTLIALLVWFMFSPQCISTFGVIKRETKGYKWPIIIGIYTLTMSYIFSYLAYNIFSVFY